MQSLGLAVSLLVALLVVPSLVRMFGERRLVRPNYRGAPLPAPLGVAVPLCAMIALAPLSLVQRLTGTVIFTAAVFPAVLYVTGVSLLGLLDDFTAGAGPRGWRGHASAVARGRFSAGAAKAAGAAGLALFVMLDGHRSVASYLVAAGVLVVATNLFNLLDLRPGRSAKALALLGLALTLGTLSSRSLFELGVFVGPALLLAPLDLRERVMLGDAGSNALGAVAGLWLVATLSLTGQAIALGLMAVLTVYGEFRSISAAIERLPLLRHLDSLGRISHA